MKSAGLEVCRGQSGIGFIVQCDGKEYQSRALIVATGKRPRMLNVPGEAEFRVKGELLRHSMGRYPEIAVRQ